MYKFFLQLWLRWAFAIILFSTLFASFISFIITIFLYLTNGISGLNSEIISGLKDIYLFFFPISFSLSILISLFLSTKYIFNRCYNKYKLELLTCSNKEVIKVIGYGDLIKVWRKLFSTMVWFTSIILIISLVFTTIFTSYTTLFEWFNIYFLLSFILLSGYISLIILSSRCKNVKISKC